LQDIDSFVVIEYIKSSIEILLSLKLEEQDKGSKKGMKKRNLPNYYFEIGNSKDKEN